MKKSAIALVHAGFWACYFILIGVILGAVYGRGPVDESKFIEAFNGILFFAVIPSAMSFYAFYFLVFPEYLKSKRLLRPLVYAVLISFASATIGFGLMRAVFGPECFADEEETSEIDIILFMSFITFVCGVIALVIKGFITWFGDIKLKEELKQKNHEMEMALVKSQLDPHFLFNTLNNIDVLILKDALKASNYLNKLSDIMRFMLYETKPDKIPLSKEIQYIEKYIELQRIRTSNTNYVNFSITGSPEGRTIAPMVFIPFIENAFKHTPNKKLKNAVEIRIDISQKSIEMSCQNRFNPTSKVKQESGGLGNELIKKRLSLLYPEKHTLAVTNADDLYSVCLTIYNGEV